MGKMWVFDSRNENNNLSEFIKKVTFDLQFKTGDVPVSFPTTYTVSRWPYRYQGKVKCLPISMTIEILFNEPFASLLPGQDGVIKCGPHIFDNNDFKGGGEVKWNKILEIGNNLK